MMRQDALVTRESSTIGAGGAKENITLSTVLSCKCSYQDNSRRHDVQAGLQATKGSARCFFKASVSGLLVGDLVSIDGTHRGRIKSIDNVDNSALVLHD